MKKLLVFCILFCLSVGMLQSPVYAAEDTVFVAMSSKWSYYVTDTDGFHDMDKDWTTAALDGDWSIGSAPFGDRIDHSNAEKSGWTGEDHAIFARQSFTLKSATAFKNLHFYLSAYYDNTIHVYLNGTEIFAHDNAGSSDWVDDYVTIELKDAGKLLQKGENILAVSVLNNTGGRELDLSLFATVEPISEGTVPPLDRPDDSVEPNEPKPPQTTAPVDAGSKLPFANSTIVTDAPIVTVYVTAEAVKMPPAPTVSYLVPMATVGGALGVSALMIIAALLISRRHRKSGGTK